MTHTLRPASAALLLVDVQQGFHDASWGTRNNPQAEANMARLLAAWRDRGGFIVHVQHLSTEPDSPLRPDRPGVQIQDAVQPLDGEPLIQKHVNSAFVGTDLDERLTMQGVQTIVIAGLTTNHCVSTTARMAENLGYRVIVVDDATAAFDHTDHTGRHFGAETLHAAALANLHDEFAEIMSTDDVIARWAREARPSPTKPS
jgi:nicotinamidase-related amidase